MDTSPTALGYVTEQNKYDPVTNDTAHSGVGSVSTLSNIYSEEAKPNNCIGFIWWHGQSTTKLPQQLELPLVFP